MPFNLRRIKLRTEPPKPKPKPQKSAPVATSGADDIVEAMRVAANAASVPWRPPAVPATSPVTAATPRPIPSSAVLRHAIADGEMNSRDFVWSIRHLPAGMIAPFFFYRGANLSSVSLAAARRYRPDAPEHAAMIIYRNSRTWRVAQQTEAYLGPMYPGISSSAVQTTGDDPPLSFRILPTHMTLLLEVYAERASRDRELYTALLQDVMSSVSRTATMNSYAMVIFDHEPTVNRSGVGNYTAAEVLMLETASCTPRIVESLVDRLADPVEASSTRSTVRRLRAYSIARQPSSEADGPRSLPFVFL